GGGGGLVEGGMGLLDRRNDGEDHARNGKIEVAQEQPLDRIGKYQLLANEAAREVTDESLPPRQEDDHEADNYAGERERKGQHCYQHGTAWKSMPLQEQACDCCNDKARGGGRAPEQHRVDQGRAIARLNDDRGIGPKPSFATRAGDHELDHRQQKERRSDEDERQQAEPQERPMRKTSSMSIKSGSRFCEKGHDQT